MIKPIVAKLISPPKVSNFWGAYHGRVDVYCLLPYICSTKLLTEISCATQYVWQGFCTVGLYSQHNCSAGIGPAALPVIVFIDSSQLMQKLHCRGLWALGGALGVQLLPGHGMHGEIHAAVATHFFVGGVDDGVHREVGYVLADDFGSLLSLRYFVFFLGCFGCLKAHICKELHHVIGCVGKKHRNPMELVHVVRRVYAIGCTERSEHLCW